MSVLKGDYIGFSYNGVHSSDLGIVRTSDGSRFNENLLPTMQDKTVQVPGGDGTYFFGSYFTQRQFSVSFAFDSLTEQQVARLRTHFGDKQIHDLIFDERPYKVYSAKVTGTATLKYIPMNEQNARVYKGEGTIQFTCYYPFAYCWNTTKDSYKQHLAYLVKDESGALVTCSDFNDRVAEWWDSSKIESGGNFGDIDAPFTLDIAGEGSIATNNGEIKWNLPEDMNATLNTKTGLAIDTNGDIVNRYLSGNVTMKIPVGAGQGEESNQIILIGGNNLNYKCYYF